MGGTSAMRWLPESGSALLGSASAADHQLHPKSNADGGGQRKLLVGWFVFHTRQTPSGCRETSVGFGRACMMTGWNVLENRRVNGMKVFYRFSAPYDFWATLPERTRTVRSPRRNRLDEDRYNRI